MSCSRFLWYSENLFHFEKKCLRWYKSFGSARRKFETKCIKPLLRYTNLPVEHLECINKQEKSEKCKEFRTGLLQEEEKKLEEAQGEVRQKIYDYTIGGKNKEEFVFSSEFNSR